MNVCTFVAYFVYGGAVAAFVLLIALFIIDGRGEGWDS